MHINNVFWCYKSKNVTSRPPVFSTFSEAIVSMIVTNTNKQNIPDFSIKINNALLENCKSYKYLGEDSGIRWLCPTCRENSISSANKVSDSESRDAPNSAGQKIPDSVCSKLKYGKCPHGITGKTLYKGKTCEFLHPKFCKKFVKNGYGGRFGCKDSRENCQYFHPTLCRNSVKFKKCLNAKCTFTHLKGTVRKEYETRNFPQFLHRIKLRLMIWILKTIIFGKQNTFKGRVLKV